MNSTVKTLLSLLTVAVLSLGLLLGSDVVTRTLLAEQESAVVGETFGEILDAKRYTPLATQGWEEVAAAYSAHDEQGNVVGYAVTVTVQGYVNTIEVHAALSADGKKVEGVRIGAHSETAGYGARITNTVFTGQFDKVTPPVYLKGSEAATLKDGVYRATGETDSSGFRDTVEVTIAGGEITAVNWDAANGAGETKKELSKAGQYVMSETGLAWHQQAEIMEQALLHTQDPAQLIYDPDTGRTDAYAGATIQVTPFVRLAAQALSEAKGTRTAADGTAIDGISGATTSSKAVIGAVNTAVRFVQDYVKP